ncbi:M20 family metallopeptidase [Mesorhizobium sp. SARCC-RB16n]|uniref:M20 metallopeptidase family protein n=1 Tax=Mesorhizobium sp. SARCC-RB16n TaxID=2116687 RepID=UPI0016689969|nr:M20 family metallopeptidase [Mesorhizobium sp. SARCC-RB16n]
MKTIDSSVVDLQGAVGHLPPGSEEKILALRHHLHANPELSNQGYATQKKIAEMLTFEGIHDPGIFHATGLYVDIVGEGNGTPLKVVVRGDIDALPVEEARSDLPFRSRHPGKMHARGRDAHASAAFGVVLAALAQRKHSAGTVRVVFQPAEEAEPLGGRTVAGQGLLEGFDCAVGMHVNPEIQSGTFSVLVGPVTKSSDEFRVIFKGKRSHCAWPELGVDAIAIACAFVNEAQKLISRESHVDEASVISIGQFQGGEATNIVCDRGVIDGTRRTRSLDARRNLCRRLEELARHIALMHRGEAGFQLTAGEPAVVNYPIVSQYATPAIGGFLGKGAGPDETSRESGMISASMPRSYHQSTSGLDVTTRISETSLMFTHPSLAFRIRMFYGQRAQPGPSLGHSSVPYRKMES